MPDGTVLPADPGLELRLIDIRDLPDDAIHAQSRQEYERAARFHFVRHRHRYLAGRYSLRIILSDWTGIAPASLRFGERGKGKPVLLDRPDIHFNLSYSDETILIGVTRENELGVDIERRRPFPDARALAEACFDKAEQAALRDPRSAMTEGDRFLCGWTRKEAALKAAALGLVHDPQQISTGIEAAPRKLTIGKSVRVAVNTMITDEHMISWASIL